MTSIRLRPQAEKFAELFSGNTTCYGLHVPESAEEGTKAKGKSFTKREALTLTHYMEHLHGESSIGVVPITQDGTVRFAVIDVDVYPMEPMQYLRTIKRANVPMVGFRSKSGGLHLYCFFKKDTEAKVAVSLLNKVRLLLGLPADTELFPKQVRLAKDQTGNWINLPYQDAANTVRYAYDENGNKLTLEQALDYIQPRLTTDKALEGTLEAVPYSDAPPCIQSLALSGGPGKGHRNEFLFDAATYLKERYGDNYEEELLRLNETLDDPIDYNELLRTTVASQNKGTYAYRCKSAHLSLVCNKDECYARKFGKESVSNVSFERFIMVEGDSVYFKWTINGVELTFYGAAELRNQHRFIEKCIEQADVFPKELPKKQWEELLQRTFANKEVVSADEQDDLSTNALWRSKLADFLSSRPAIRPGQVEEGLVYYDEKHKVLHFRGTKLFEYFEKSRLFSDFKKGQHGHLLKKVGASHGHLYIPEAKRTKRTWKVELTRIQDELRITLDLCKLGMNYIDDNTGDVVVEDFTDETQEKF